MRNLNTWLALTVVGTATGCNSILGPPTIPPPAVSQGPAGDYYPSPFVTPPPGTFAPTTPGGTAPLSGSGGLSWQTPNLVTARGATISRSTLADSRTEEREAPIRIVDNGAKPSVIPPSGSASSATSIARSPQPANDYVEISQLPKPAGVLQAVPATNRVRGFIPAEPQQNAVPTQPASGSTPPATIAKPRFGSTLPSERFDSAVRPAGFEQPVQTSGEASDGLRWRSR